MKRLPALATLTALAALFPAQVHAQAQAVKACLTEREVAQMAIYAVPSLVEGVRLKCANRLSPKGFLALQGTTVATKYAALQNETWPVAKSAVLKYVGGKAGAAQGKGTLTQLASLPDQAVRRLVDAMIAQEVGKSITLGNCANVERGIQLASVMNPRDSGAMIAFVVAMVKPKDPPICPARP